jgi:uncharacterized membrane protein (UPF0127 family)
MNRTMEGLVAGPRGAAFALLGVEGRPVNLGVEVAGSIRQRLRGWLGRMQAPRERGLWLVPCDAVHTMAMRFPVDLVFVDGGGRILRIHAAVPPWRVRICLGAHSVIELAAGQAASLGLAVGDCLERRRV